MQIFDKKTEEKKEKTSGASMKDLYVGNAPVKTTATGEKKTATKRVNAYKVLVKPLVTEKASILGIQNKYVFKVYNNANKIEVAKAIEEVYGVKPASVNIVKVLGKITRYGRIAGKRSDWKKAIVTLPKGATIKVYEGV